MNFILLVVLIVLLGAHLLQCWAEMQNLKSLKPDVPAELTDVHDEKTYRTSQEYPRAKTRLELISSNLSLAALFIFILAGGLPWLDQTIRSLGLHSVLTGLVFLGLLGLAVDILALPFQLYSTFVLEERFGFNRMSLSTFIQDKLKGLVLALLIGGPCLAGIIVFLSTYPAWGWVLAWAGLTVVMIGLQYIAPNWILPLFNTFTPLEDGELKTKILDYARQNGVTVQDISVMDGSKRSAKSNAFFTGFGRKKKIALFDTLIDKHTPDELVAVLAHEIGHWKLRHILKGLVLAIVKMGIILGLLSVVVSYKPLFTAFGLEQVSVHAGLFLFLLVYTPVSLLLSVGTSYISRQHEFQADAFAAKTTGQPEYLLQALKKLSKDNLSNLTPHPLKVVLEYSHPPVIERIKALQRMW
ncbi:MAG: M48 family metallopeptidase [Desulfovermiculus sp.]|nr:M48 family metallopeptidase [Desulfovermiculus sp.]